MKSTRWTTIALASAAVLAAGIPARAGLRQEYTVEVSPTYRWARGYLGSARNSGDSMQYIGCSIAGNAAPNGLLTMSCYARDSGGTSLVCNTQDLTMIRQAYTLKGDSWMIFWSRSDGACNGMQIVNASYAPPKNR